MPLLALRVSLPRLQESRVPFRHRSIHTGHRELTVSGTGSRCFPVVSAHESGHEGHADGATSSAAQVGQQ